MPFCRNCGKEIRQEALNCPYCGFSQIKMQTKPTATVVVHQGSDVEDALGVIVLIALLIGGICFVAAVEIFDCPSCGNDVWWRWACPYCGHDGKVTLIQLITYPNG